jgi:hypothetical protein
MRIPDDAVARVDDVIVLDAHVVGVPDADGVAAHALLRRLRGDAIAPHDIVVRLLQVETEQAILEHIVLDDVELSAQLDARVRLLVPITAVAECQIRHDGPVGLDRQQRADAAAVDDRAPGALQRHRPRDRRRRGVDPGRKLEHAALRRRVDQGLQRHGARGQRAHALAMGGGRRRRVILVACGRRRRAATQAERQKPDARPTRRAAPSHVQLSLVSSAWMALRRINAETASAAAPTHITAKPMLG